MTIKKDYLFCQISSLPYFRGFLRAVEAGFYDDIDLPAPVLDLGCGDGHFAALTFDRKLDIGTDPWWEPLRESAERRAYRMLAQTDGADQPFPADYFASAVSNSVLEHIDHIDDVLRDTARVLKPGAPFIFCLPNERYLTELSIAGFLERIGMRRLAAAYREWFRKVTRTYHADQPEVWEQRLQRAGFVLDRHWDYFSPKALSILEWGHFFGVPSLVSRWLTGRWVLVPTRWNLFWIERYLRPYAQSVPDPLGTYTFFIAHKR